MQAAYQTCALSKKPLSSPIVSCPLGRLYNKDSLLEYLLTPASADLPVSATPFGADGLATAGHIRSLKDVTELKLTPNTSQTGKDKASRAGETDASLGTSPFICPISQKPMNGSVRFVYLLHCGSVASESALREIRTPASKSKGKKRSPSGSESEESSNSARDAPQLEPCSLCGAPYVPGEPELGRIINPTNPDEIAKLKLEWEATKAAQKAAKKVKNGGSTGKKRKAGTEHGGEEKRAKKDALAQAALAQNESSRGAPRLPSSMIAALDAKREQMASTAVASLYAKHDPNAKEDWMVRGTLKSRV